MTPLPIDEHLTRVIEALRDERVCVLVAEPGAGKTTRVPPAILEAGLMGKPNDRLVMLQPRRIAARAAAARIASERGWSLGNEVGYHIRFEKRLTDSTRLRVLTEGLFTRQIVADPFLEGVGCVVLDEFHERSLDIDLALAMLREVREGARDDLLIVVMSATLDAESVATFLGGAPILQIPGRTFPVAVEHARPSALKLPERVASVVASIDDPGDVLVFLPGVSEIERTHRALGSVDGRFDLRMLHGSLSFDAQQQALAPSDRGRIVLSTNIAETSLTIDGVTTVVDSGLARVPRFDPRRGLDRLELVRISKASSTQRAGRAGRTRPGRCIRLWTASEHAALRDFEDAEVRRVDLAPTVLALRSWGVSDPRAFGWFDRPDDTSLDAAERLLHLLDAIDADNRITSTGEQLARLPVHPRIGRLLIAGVDMGVPGPACAMAALLSEKDIVRDDESRATGTPRTTGPSDLLWRLAILDDERSAHAPNIDRIALRQVRRVRDELDRITRRLRPHRSQPAIDADPLLLLPLLAYPDRVCRRRDHASGTMVGGGGVRLDPACVVREGEFFVALDARSDQRSRSREATVRIASRVEREWIETLLASSIRTDRAVTFDESSAKATAWKRTVLVDLPLREVREQNVDALEVSRALAEALKPRAAELFEQDESASRLLARLRFVQRVAPELSWPRIEPASWIEDACVGRRSAEQLDLAGAIRSRLVYPLDRKLDEFAPESVEVPTGSVIRLDYANVNTAPVLAVRLQELFGLPETPRIAGGRVKVLLHLLAPNYRPVQVTDDLASFWKNTYEQVRKDLRARYPKHAWPDDPANSQAIRGPRKRRS
jgi:ATP-dependent helicase HrpB